MTTATDEHVAYGAGIILGRRQALAAAADGATPADLAAHATSLDHRADAVENHRRAQALRGWAEGVRRQARSFAVLEATTRAERLVRRTHAHAR